MEDDAYEEFTEREEKLIEKLMDVKKVDIVGVFTTINKLCKEHFGLAITDYSPREATQPKDGPTHEQRGKRRY